MAYQIATAYVMPAAYIIVGTPYNTGAFPKQYKAATIYDNTILANLITGYKSNVHHVKSFKDATVFLTPVWIKQ